MSQGHACIFFLMTLCSVKHIYKSQSVNAVHPVIVLFTNKEIGAYTESFASFPSADISCCCLINHIRSIGRETFAKSISDVEREIDNMVGSEHLRRLA